MDGIDSGGKVVIPDHTLISDSVRDKGGQGARPQYYVRKRPPGEPGAAEEELQPEVPAEPGKPRHLIDIKV
jgi:hypothetical protein